MNFLHKVLLLGTAVARIAFSWNTVSPYEEGREMISFGICSFSFLIFSFSFSFRANFMHKVLLLRAEAARVAFSWNTVSPFEEGKEIIYFHHITNLYEEAIASAKHYKFTQYEALGNIPSPSPPALAPFPLPPILCAPSPSPLPSAPPASAPPASAPSPSLPYPSPFPRGGRRTCANTF